jgi:hypothetical protein
MAAAGHRVITIVVVQQKAASMIPERGFAAYENDGQDGTGN